ncbi:ankyrin-1-like [Copidosoma floridanum]|uniref:ankyrin-1-like n=1 Tax=Copidosoma floridanum TaxID=29053 RepID=UPI0006C95217|nr:ankyrin-1-like [Copidosoma floridanum]
MTDKSKAQSLHDAVRLGDIKMVHTILKRDPSCVNDWDRDLKTPLHVVYDDVNYDNLVQDGDRLLMMQVLIDCGADVNARGGRLDESVLHVAVNKKHINGVECLLRNEANPDIQNTINETALHYAVRMRSEGIMRLLLSNNANPNINDAFHQTPLDYVVCNRDIDYLKILTDYGVKSLNIYKLIGQLCQRRLEPLDNLLLEYLYEYGPSLNDCFSYRTLSYYLISNYHLFINIKHCSFYDLVYENSNSLDREMHLSDLHLAAYNLDVEFVKDLLKKGVNVNIKNSFDETPLHVVLRKHFWFTQKTRKIILLLIKHGSDLRAQNYLHETPFFLATRALIPPLINLMLAKIAGVKPSILNHSINYFDAFWTADFKTKPELYELFVASTLGYVEIVDRFLDISFIDEASKNCCETINKILGNAMVKKQYSIVKILLEAGFIVDGHFNLYLSLLRIHKCEEDDLSIACLCREFGDNATINQMIRRTFNYVISNGPINEFTYLLVFMYTISLRKENLSKDFIPSKGLFKLQNDVSKIISECNVILDELKKDEANNMSIFDVITMPFNFESNSQITDYWDMTEYWDIDLK